MPVALVGSERGSKFVWGPLKSLKAKMLADWWEMSAWSIHIVEKWFAKLKTITKIKTFKVNAYNIFDSYKKDTKKPS